MPVSIPINIALGVLLLAYPALVYFGLQSHSPRAIAVVVVLATTLRTLLIRDHTSLLMWLAALTAAAFSWLGDSALGLKCYPVFISMCMLTVFSMSLWRGPTVIERLARIQDPDLPPAGIIYCRKVTQVWCLFFIINGSIAGGTVFADDMTWALYNGLIAYIAMGMLFAGEYIFRQRSIKKNQP